jgi:hypothetical protein
MEVVANFIEKHQLLSCGSGHIDRESSFATAWIMLIVCSEREFYHTEHYIRGNI